MKELYYILISVLLLTTLYGVGLSLYYKLVEKCNICTSVIMALTFMSSVALCSTIHKAFINLSI